MVTPLALEEGTALALSFAVAFDDFGAAAVVSITDDLVFLGEWGAGLLALAAGFLICLGAGSTCLATTFLTGLATLAAFVAFAAGFTTFAAGLDFAAGTALRAAAAGFFATAAERGFADFAFAVAGLLLAAGRVLDLAAFTAGFALGLAAALARATTLVDLALAFGFCLILAISVLSL